MKSGRELDALIAEKVFGWKKAQPWEEGMPRYLKSNQYFYQDSDGGYHEINGFPNYSTDIAAAWEVVTSMEAEFDWWATNTAAGRKNFQFANRIKDVRSQGDGTADDLPLAICLAALKAVGVEV